MPYQPDVDISQAFERALKPMEKGAQKKDGAIRWPVSWWHRFQKRGAENRGEDQGHQHRKEHGGGDGHGKLAIDDPGGTGKEGHGAKCRHGVCETEGLESA